MTRPAMAIVILLMSVFLIAGLNRQGSLDGPENRFRVFVVSAMIKVRSSYRPDRNVSADSHSVRIKAARGEFEPFQIVVAAGGAPLRNLRASASELKGPDGATVDAPRLYRVADIHLEHASNRDGNKGDWPDPLIPDEDAYFGERRNAFPVQLAAGRLQPIWGEVWIPIGTPAGIYRGQVQVEADDSVAVSLPIELTVWEFDLPATSSLNTAFAAGHSSLVMGHFDKNYVDDETQIDLIKLYSRALLAHRLSNDQMIYPAPPFDGKQIDWRRFDADWGPFLDGTALPTGAKITAIRLQAHGYEDKPAYLEAYQRHFEEKGWLDRLFAYTWDEPQEEDIPFVVRKASLLRSAAPEIRSLVTQPLRSDLYGSVDIWCPVINWIEDKPERRVTEQSPPLSDYRRRFENRAEALWWYQSCMSHGCGPEASRDPYFTGWPSYVVDAPAAAHRIMSWLSFRYNVKGELYYHTTFAYSEGDPWKSLYYFSGNGDGTLFYPGRSERIGGTNPIPIESIRLKMIREGLEDYEYLVLLSRLKGRPKAEAIASRLARTPYDWTDDPASFDRVRGEIAAIIVAAEARAK